MIMFRMLVKHNVNILNSATCQVETNKTEKKKKSNSLNQMAAYMLGEIQYDILS